MLLDHLTASIFHGCRFARSWSTAFHSGLGVIYTRHMPCNQFPPSSPCVWPLESKILEIKCTCVFSIWNSLDIITYVLQVAISVMFFGRYYLESTTLSALLAAQVLLMCWRVRLRFVMLPLIMTASFWPFVMNNL